MSAIKEAFDNRVPESAIEVIGKLQYDASKAHFTAGFKAGLERAAKECVSRYMGDNNREDMEVKRCGKVIRQLAKEE